VKLGVEMSGKPKMGILKKAANRLTQDGAANTSQL
jgi:hypothetical protein